MQASGTNIVAIGAAQPRPTSPHVSALHARTSAAFTAQLLAMRHDVPCFRQRRRIEPGLAVAAYRAAAATRSRQRSLGTEA